MPKRAAIYLRTSTREQHLDCQEPDCVQLAAARDLEVVEVYREQESAAKRRPVFERLMADAHRHRFAVLILCDAPSQGGRGCAGRGACAQRGGFAIRDLRFEWDTI